MGNIAFIGGGNMAASLIGGLLAGGRSADTVFVADPSDERLKWLEAQFEINTSADNLQAIKSCQTIVLAVKPQVLEAAASEIGRQIATANPLIISVAAGVNEPDIRRWLGYEASIVRTMPNTPALVGAGASALYANENVSADAITLADTIMRAVGITVWVDEETQLDAVTAVSGSGPAYCFLLMELMAQTGEQLGLSAQVSRSLTLQTMFGAAKMAQQSDVGPDVLRQRVTSPGGTTQRALEIFEANDIKRIVAEALTGARDRARELGEQLGGS